MAQLTFQAHKSHIYELLFFPKGSSFITTSDCGLKMWDTLYWGDACSEYFPDNSKRCFLGRYAAISSDGKWLVTTISDDSPIVIFEITISDEFSSLSLFRCLDKMCSWTNSLTFSPNGKYLAVDQGNRSISIWNAETWKHLTTLKRKANFSSQQDVTFSPCGNWLLVTSTNQFTFFETQTWKTFQVIEEKNNYCLSPTWSRDGKWLVSGSYCGKIYILDMSLIEQFEKQTKESQDEESQDEEKIQSSLILEKYTILRSISPPEMDHWVTAFLFLPDTHWMFSGADDCQLRLWDTETWTCVEAIDVKYKISRIALSPDGQWIIATGSTNPGMVFNVKIRDQFSILKLDEILAVGLACSCGEWSSFLQKGLYDPRLFLLIRSFLFSFFAEKEK